MSYGYNTTGPAQECVPQMEPLTSQLGGRISESNNMLQELTSRLYTVCEKLLGSEGKLTSSLNSDMLAKEQRIEAVANGVMDKLLRDSKMVNQRLMEIENLVRRLESL